MRDSIKAELLKIKQALLNGVSFAIPFIACGGILLATSFTMVPIGPNGPTFEHAPVADLIHQIGASSFALMLPVLAGYISYALANKPGLVPGFIGGFLAGHLPTEAVQPDGSHFASAGFLGAILAGLLAGYVVNFIKKAPVPKFLKPIMPILIIPIFASLFVGVLMLEVIGFPIAELMKFLTGWLSSLTGANSVLLGAVLGAMIAFDMGGPVNKTAFFFGAAMINEGNCTIMGACAAAICTPPLGLGFATLIRKSLWTEEQRDAGIASLAMGTMGITEGAIPFAAADPFRVIPCIMAGSMIASILAMQGHVLDVAPHGGLIVLPVITHPIAYVLAILAGIILTALCINLVKSSDIQALSKSS